MPKKRKKRKKSARQAFLAAQKRKGLTEGQALYRWRLLRGLRAGKDVRAARGHERTEAPVKKPRSQTAKSLGYDPRDLRRRTLRPKSGDQQGHDVLFFGMAHLTKRRQERRFVSEVFPAALRLEKRYRSLGGKGAVFRIVFQGWRRASGGSNVVYDPEEADLSDPGVGSTTWERVGSSGSRLKRFFYEIWELVPLIAIYLSEFV